MINARDQDPGAYEFDHSLLQQTLIDEVLPLRRTELHAQIAKALIQSYDDGADSHAAEIVSHLEQAGVQIDGDELAYFSLVAGGQAIDASAWDDGLRHFSRGVEATAGDPMTTQRAHLLVGLARSLRNHSGARFDFGSEAYPYLEQAFHYFAEHNMKSDAALLGQYVIGRLESDGSISNLAAEAMLFAEPDTDVANHIWSTRTILNFYSTGNYESAVTECERQLTRAVERDDATGELRSYTARVRVEQANGADTNLSLAERLLELAPFVDDPLAGVHCSGMAAWAYLWAGQRVNAASIAARYLDAAARMPHIKHNALMVNAILAAHVGDWQEAIDHSSQAKAVPGVTLPCNALATESRSNWELGQMDAARRALEEGIELARPIIREGRRFTPMLFLLHIFELSRLTSDRTHLLIAERAISPTPAGPDHHQHGPRAFETMNQHSLTILHAACAVARGNQPDSARYFDDLKGQSLKKFGHRKMALVAETAGLVAEAVSHFEASLAFNRKAGYDSETAWTCCDYADLLRKSGSSSDLRLAGQLLDEGLALADSHGMLSLASRINKRPQSPPANLRDGVTGREAEVLGLIAKGYTNKEVGEFLHISGSTVANHLRNIYEKTGTANRTEASAYATRNGWMGNFSGNL